MSEVPLYLVLPADPGRGYPALCLGLRAYGLGLTVQVGLRVEG